MNSPIEADAPDIDTPRLTLQSLRAVGRKGGAKSHADPYWVSRYFYRPFTIYITWVCMKLGLTANGITLLSGIAVFAGAVCFMLPSPGAWLAGALLVQAYFLLDHCDGEAARYERVVLKRRTGMVGYFYDTVCHAGEPAVVVAIGLRLFADMGHPWWVGLILIFAFFPGGLQPWQRSCETIIEYARGIPDDQPVLIPREQIRKPSLSEIQGAATPSVAHRAARAVSQLIGFPGFFLTLLICTVLDVIPGVPHIRLGELMIPYLLLWLGVRSLHSSAASIKSLILSARLLRKLGA